MEIELKLSIAARDIKTFRAHPLLKQYAVAAPRRQKMADTYFDTTEHDIRSHHAGLRVRHVAQGWIQTMKAGGSVDGGLHSRNEWETAVVVPVPDLAALQAEIGDKNKWRKLVRTSGLQDRLIPVFTTQVTRTIWDLHTPQGDRIECVLDQGSIHCGTARVAISEVELELKSGIAAGLFDLALLLLDDIPLQIGTLSKSDRGYALFASQAGVHAVTDAVTAAPLTLTRRMTVEQAFEAIVAGCLAQIVANAPGLVRQAETESLHQMRVGLRRLDSALTLYKDVLRLPADLAAELKWLEHQLGGARDWDVLAGTTLPAIFNAAPDGLQQADIMLAVLKKARESHAVAAAAVDSQRFTRLVLGVTRWMVNRDWRTGKTPKQLDRLSGKLEKFARRALILDQRHLLAQGEKLRAADAKTRHRVRIAAKELRYTTEFFGALYSAKKVRPYVKALSTLQDRLGWLNDAAVADRLLQEVGVLHEGTGIILQALLVHGKQGDRKTRKAWKKFAALKLPVGR